MERLLDLLGQSVQFAYTCWDRIVLNGYIERLQRPENLVHFFHDVVGIACIEPAVLEQRTKRLPRLGTLRHRRVGHPGPARAAQTRAQRGLRPTLLSPLEG